MNCFSNKTILVTGATGLIGSNLINSLMSETNTKIIALSRREDKLKTAFRQYENNPNFCCMAQDICTPLLIEEPVDYIFHAAGPMERDIVLNHPLDVIMPNLIGTKNCFDFMVNQKQKSGHPCRLVLFSSVTVYGNDSLKDRSVTEEQTELTENLNGSKASYSQSKRMSEIIALSYNKQYGTDSVIARFSTVYGNTCFLPHTAFFEFINTALNGQDIVVNVSGSARRDNIYIDDAISGLLTVAEKGVCGEAYNISSNGELENFAAIDEIAESIATVVNHSQFIPTPIKVILSHKTTSRFPGICLNNDKLKKLGWKPEVSMSDGIKQTINNIFTKQNQKKG